MKISARQIFGLGVALVMIAFVVMATDFNDQARMLPLIIGVPVMLLAIYQAFADLRAGAAEPAAAPAAL